MVAHAFVFMLPLFRFVLLVPATEAGTRLAIPSLAKSIAHIIANILVSLRVIVSLVRAGMVLMTY